MKCPAGAHPLRRLSFGSSDWQLLRACPATLMLVRPRPWQAVPEFAALVDVSNEDSASLAEIIVHTSEYFALGCRGELDVVYSEPGGDNEATQTRSAILQRLTGEYRIGAQHVHVLNGDPELTLPEFAARQHYDALVLGGLTHRKGMAALAGTLTGKLVDALDCDFILVKRPGHGPARQLAMSAQAAGIPQVSLPTGSSEGRAARLP
jgi:universal stress protein E